MASGSIIFDSIQMHSPQRPKHKRNKSSVLKALVSPIGHKRHTSENNFYEKNENTSTGKQNIATRALISPLQRYHSDDVFMRETTNVHSHLMLSSDLNAGNISKPTNTPAHAKGGAGRYTELLYKRKSIGNGRDEYENWKLANGGTVKDKENSTPPSSVPALDTTEAPMPSHFTSTKPMQMPGASTGIDSPDSTQKLLNMSESDYTGEKGRGINKRALKVGNGNAGKPSVGEMRNSNRHQHRYGTADALPRRPLSVASAQTVQCPAESASRAGQSPTKLPRDERMPDEEAKKDYDAEAINKAFEEVLDARNIPEIMRQKMRSLNSSIKADFIRKNSSGMPKLAQEGETGHKLSSNPLESPKVTHATTGRVAVKNLNEYDAAEASPEKRIRIRSRTFNLSKGESVAKKQKAERSDVSSGLLRLKETPELLSVKPLQSMASGIGSWSRSLRQAALPDDFVAYLRKVQKPENVEVEKIHKLRLLLRNETVSWVNNFIGSGGMAEIVELVYRILEIEWREEHEDQLLHESLLCLKGLSTTDLAQKKLCEVESKLFPILLATLFDKEHKGPSEFTTRSIIINLLFAHLSSALQDKIQLTACTHTILSYLKDPQPEESSKPLEFILDMQQSRPYRVWCREITNVTKEVFWIFVHQMNVIPLDKTPRTEASSTQTPDQAQEHSSYINSFYPPPRPPVPAAPYVGGVEWDATNYLAAHLDLLNGIIACLPTHTERNALRAELRLSGFEKIMGSSLRTCREKFYGSVHAGLRTWAAAAAADGWSASDVRAGPKENIMAMAAAATAAAGRKSPAKKKKKSGDDSGGEMLNVAVQPLKLELDSAKGRDGLDLNLGLGLDLQFGSRAEEKQSKVEGTGWV